MSLAAVFLQTSRSAILKQALDWLSSIQPEPNRKSTFLDDLASADITSAEYLMRQLAAYPNSDEIVDFSGYLDQISANLERARDRGYPRLLTPPIDSAVNASLAETAKTLGQAPIKAEACLGVIAWLIQNSPRAIEYLQSSLLKAKAVAEARASKFVDVDEKEVITIDSSTHQKEWHYRGRRPSQEAQLDWPKTSSLLCWWLKGRLPILGQIRYSQIGRR